MHRFPARQVVWGAVLWLVSAPAAWATPLYAISFTTTEGSVLYQVDLQTGQASSPKTTGLDHIVGIAFGSGGVLYGLTNATAPTHPNALVVIDPVTGAAQLVGATGLQTIVEGDLAWDRTTGQLYGLYDLASGQRRLFTLNAASGAATTLPISLSGDPSAMAFDSAGTLYVIDTSLGRLLTVNKLTGETLASVSLSSALGSVAGMAVEPQTHVFYVADGDSGGTDRLHSLNPPTGVLTVVGPTGLPDGLAGLAFIPEPVSLALLGMGAMILWGCPRKPAIGR